MKPPKGKRRQRKPWVLAPVPGTLKAKEDISPLFFDEDNLRSLRVIGVTDPEERRKIIARLNWAHDRGATARRDRILQDARQLEATKAAFEHIRDLARDDDFRVCLNIAKDMMISDGGISDRFTSITKIIDDLYFALRMNVWEYVIEYIDKKAKEGNEKRAKGRIKDEYKLGFIEGMVMMYEMDHGESPPVDALEGAAMRNSPGALFHDFIHAALEDLGIRTSPKAASQAIKRVVQRRSIKTSR